MSSHIYCSLWSYCFQQGLHSAYGLLDYRPKAWKNHKRRGLGLSQHHSISSIYYRTLPVDCLLHIAKLCLRKWNCKHCGFQKLVWSSYRYSAILCAYSLFLWHSLQTWSNPKVSLCFLIHQHLIFCSRFRFGLWFRTFLYL